MTTSGRLVLDLKDGKLKLFSDTGRSVLLSGVGYGCPECECDEPEPDDREFYMCWLGVTQKVGNLQNPTTIIVQPPFKISSPQYSNDECGWDCSPDDNKEGSDRQAAAQQPTYNSQLNGSRSIESQH